MSDLCCGQCGSDDLADPTSYVIRLGLGDENYYKSTLFCRDKSWIDFCDRGPHSCDYIEKETADKAHKFGRKYDALKVLKRLKESGYPDAKVLRGFCVVTEFWEEVVE